MSRKARRASTMPWRPVHTCRLDPCSDGVLGFEIRRRRVENGLRRFKTFALPFEAALDHPCENARPFGFELLGKLSVGFLGRDGDREGNEVEPPSYGFVDAAQTRLVVAGDDEFELRRELEKILPHEASRYPVAAGQRLDAQLRPASAFFRLDGRDEARALQAGQVCRMPVGIAGRKSIDARRLL